MDGSTEKVDGAASSSTYRYTPIFSSSRADCFLPYEEAIFECKSHAKRFGSKNRVNMLITTGLRYSGRIFRLEGHMRYPMVEVEIDDKGNKGYVAVVDGPAYDELMAIPSNREKALAGVETEIKLSDFAD